VIAATLEMEHRLYGSHVTQRLTIRRSQLAAKLQQ
jgi:hypothetical protein